MSANDPHLDAQPVDAHGRALAINLDRSIYGTFAEIGAGQEVANWFLRVGAASGTVAQTICAYDKAVSDQRYGKGTRYVSRERLLAMLECEYDALIAQLGAQRQPTTRFFCFADTVAAKNFKGDNEQHGWLGLRFEATPGGSTSDILLHVGLQEDTAEHQQETLGLLGVNLIYAAYHCPPEPEAFLQCLFEGLGKDRLEIDVIELAGPAFANADSRVWCLQALRRGMSRAVVFDGRARPVEPASALRKRPLIVERGRFDVFAPYQAAMLRASENELRRENPTATNEPAPVLEMTLHDMTGAATPNDATLLSRVDHLAKMGTVVVSEFAPYYLLVGYLRRYTAEPIRVVMGVPAVAKLFGKQYYAALPGALLEGLGKLLSEGVKIYAYPVTVEDFHLLSGKELLGAAAPGDSGLITADDLRPEPPADLLLRYVRAAGWVVPLAPVAADQTPAR